MFKFLKLFNDFKDYFVLVILTIINLSLISINQTENISGFRSIIIGSVGYIQNALSWVPNPGALQNENKALIDLNIQLFSEVTTMRKALQENYALRSMLALEPNLRYEMIACDVTSKCSIQMRNFVTINKGTDDGVKMGMSICSVTGLVGSIIGANATFSIVELLNNKNVKIAGILSESNLDGIVEWESDDIYIYIISLNQ